MSARLPPQWLEWHPCAPVLLAGTDDGNVWMWKIPSGDCKTFQSSACQATSGKVLPDGKGHRHSTNSAKTFKETDFKSNFTLTCIFHHLSPGKRAVVGYEDGTVRVWDLKQGNAIHVIKGESDGSHIIFTFWVEIFLVEIIVRT